MPPPQKTTDQPAILRLLAIQCLLRAVETAKDGDMGDALRKISTLSGGRNLEKLAADLKTDFQGIEHSPILRISYAGNDQLLIRDPNEDAVTDDNPTDDPDAKKITSNQIRGEAYEILCAMMFKCKVDPSSVALRDYHGEANDSNLGDRDCHVRRVFLSEGRFSHQALQWCDNRSAWETYVHMDLKPYLINRARRVCADNVVILQKASQLVEDIANKFHDNVASDKGFDILVELQEEENDEGGNGRNAGSSQPPVQPQRHFILAQCKYRSNVKSEVSMAEYVGKFYEIAHLMGEYNALVGEQQTLLQFYWMSTVTEPDAMNYFTHLRFAGKIEFYGNSSFQLEHAEIDLIQNVKLEMRAWKQRCVASAEEVEAFRHSVREPREPLAHQKCAVDILKTHCRTHREEDKTTRAAVIMATGTGKTFTSFLSVKMLGEGATDRGLAASLHFSPMIRLVIQNAHEWLADERALENKLNVPNNERKIYYCICSMQDDRVALAGGCTSVRLINCSALPKVFLYHKNKGSLHRCRFFTTYQASKRLYKIVRRINLDIYGRLPSKCLFAISVLDEAHKAVGNGSKAFCASLLINARISLSFTASAIYSFYHLKRALPETFGKFDAPEKELNKDYQTYLSIDNGFVFPEIKDEHLSENPSVLSGLYEDVEWSPTDTLDEEMLFLECEWPADVRLVGSSRPTWKDFERLANAEEKSIVVFIVEDSPAFEGYHSVAFDGKDEPRYFGAVPNRIRSPVSFDINCATICFGMNEAGTKLFRPRGDKVGFSLHDFSGIGANNRIGKVVHKLSYYDAFETEVLLRPRLVMIEPNPIPLEQEDHGYWNYVFGETEDASRAKDPSKRHWTLTISGSLISATEHQFRSMRLLADLYIKREIKRTLVFCCDTEESKTCCFIFDCLWKDEMKARGDTEGQRQGDGQPQAEGSAEGLPAVHTDYIYSSATDALHGAKETMAYEEQQDKLSRFASEDFAVLFNVKLISIGVDLPSVDAAMVINPSFTQSDVTQKIGRALRVDRSDPNKVATVIIPSWDKTTGFEECRGAGDSDSDWYAPVNRNYEDTFGVTLKVVDAMMDKNIEMITSYKEASRSLNGRKPPSEQKGTTVQTIVTKLKTNNVESQDPVFDEWFSKQILTAWKPKILLFDDEPSKTALGPLSPMRPPPTVPRNLKRRDTCNAVILVAFAAHCYHRFDNVDDGTRRVTADGPSGETSYLWFKSCRPFAPDKHLGFLLEEAEEARHARALELFGFDDGLTQLQDVVVTRGRDGGRGNHKQLGALRNGIQGSERDVREQLNSFRDRLKMDLDSEDPSHATILEGFCKACPDDCSHPNGHTINQIFGEPFDEEQFFAGLARFFEAEFWMKSRRGAGSRSLVGATTEATTEPGTSMAKGVKRRLDHSFGPLDQEVQSQPPIGSPPHS